MQEKTTQYNVFREILAQHLISRQTETETETDAAELDEFIDFLASESWNAIPSSLRNATYTTRSIVPSINSNSNSNSNSIEIELEQQIQQNLSPTFIQTLISYGISSDEDEVYTFFLNKILKEYRDVVVTKPIPWSCTKRERDGLGCEICERDGIPLTYHHLIPKSTHQKWLVKSKGLNEWELNVVAWLCRPCHSMVHHVESNDVLAQEYYTVELLLGRDDIKKWRKYASKQKV